MKTTTAFSGFAKFANGTERDGFDRDVLKPAPALRRCAHFSGSRPDIVFDGLTAEQLETVRRALTGRGRWFEDVKFSTT